VGVGDAAGLGVGEAVGVVVGVAVDAGIVDGGTLVQPTSTHNIKSHDRSCLLIVVCSLSANSIPSSGVERPNGLELSRSADTGNASREFAAARRVGFSELLGSLASGEGGKGREADASCASGK